MVETKVVAARVAAVTKAVVVMAAVAHVKAAVGPAQVLESPPVVAGPTLPRARSDRRQTVIG